MTPDISLANALRQHRLAKGWSITETAEWLGIARETYSRLESGRNVNPRISTIWKFIQECVRIEAKVQCNGTDDHFHLKCQGATQ